MVIHILIDKLTTSLLFWLLFLHVHICAVDLGTYMHVLTSVDTSVCVCVCLCVCVCAYGSQMIPMGLFLDFPLFYVLGRVS